MSTYIETNVKNKDASDSQDKQKAPNSNVHFGVLSSTNTFLPGFLSGLSGST